MMGSNYFFLTQERLHYDNVINVLSEKMIIDIPHLVYSIYQSYQCILSLRDIIQTIQSEQL